tara:strand:+ start:1242 stop:2969 length:1728 start_codon:yes stop_codon:yes gene_type:complete
MPKLNVLFVVPMHITFESFIKPDSNSRTFTNKSGQRVNSLSTDLPLGPLSISAYLKKHMDINVKLIDFNAEVSSLEAFDYNSFESYIATFFKEMDFKPDLVGVSSLFSPSFQNFVDVGRVAKRTWPEAFTVGGGNIPTNSYTQIYKDLKYDFFDALCYGEGEKPMLELLKSDDYFAHVEDSTSWITSNNIVGSDYFTPQHNFVEELDQIPFLDYNLCDLEKHGVNQNLSSFHSVKNPKGFHVMTSRGCPYLCTFCASHKTHGRDMRYHSIDRVRKDLTRLVRDYGANTVVFQDDHLMASIPRVYEILSIVGELGLNSLYQNGLTLYALNMQMLQAFYDAGVRHLVLPVESGSEKVLKKQMKKPLKLSISEEVAHNCRKLNIYTNINILIGMPGETKEDLEDSRNNLRKIHGNWFNIACASPLAGSDMHQLASDHNYISDAAIGSDYHVATISTEDWDSDYIQKFQYDLNLELNFVYNNDVRYGNWENGLLGFMNVIRLRDDHAFAYYYAFLCYKKLGRTKEASDSLQKYLEFKESVFWKPFVERYNLPNSKEEALQKVEDYNPVFSIEKESLVHY